MRMYRSSFLLAMALLLAPACQDVGETPVDDAADRGAAAADKQGDGECEHDKGDGKGPCDCKHKDGEECQHKDGDCPHKDGEECAHKDGDCPHKDGEECAHKDGDCPHKDGDCPHKKAADEQAKPTEAAG